MSNAATGKESHWYCVLHEKHDQNRLLDFGCLWEMYYHKLKNIALLLGGITCTLLLNLCQNKLAPTQPSQLAPSKSMASIRSARGFQFGVGLMFGVSIGAISAAVQGHRAGEAPLEAGGERRKSGPKWLPSFVPAFESMQFKRSACEGAQKERHVAHRPQLQAAFQEPSKTPDPKNHPWIVAGSATPSTLLPEERIITFLVANAAAGKVKELKRDWSFLPPHMHAAGMEALLQNHLLVGFPRTINAIAAVHQVGVESTADWMTEPKGDPAYWRTRGEEALGTIYGAKYERLRQRMEKLHPVLDSIMAEHAYGRVISREGALSLRMRELCVVAVLTGQDVQPQLQSHLYGARNVGASAEEIAAVVGQTKLPWGVQAQEQATNTLQEFLNDIKTLERAKLEGGEHQSDGAGGSVERRSKM